MKLKTTSYLHKFYLAFLLCLTIQFQSIAQVADCQGFDSRRNTVIDNVLARGEGRSLFVIQAYKGLPVDKIALENSIKGLPDNRVADFKINQYVRLLHLTNGEYDDIILPVLKTIPFWLPDNAGSKRQYWSENHMIQWMASDWLLHEKYSDWQVRSSLRKMLVKYLDSKIQYGYYEYFSYYNAFTMTALLNLYDFSADTEIRNKAKQALYKMLKDHMLMVNNLGGYLPTSGRHEITAYRPDYFNSVVYMMTGLGEQPLSNGREAVAMATSTLDLSPICRNWSEEENVTLNYGHSINDFKSVYNGLSREDRNTFQWSAGGYFSPELANESLWLLDKYDLWDHEEFKDYSFIRYLPKFLGGTIAKIGATISRGSYIGEAEIDIYKNKGVVLSSSHEKWKGRLGYQIYPIMANVENSPVFIRSGKVYDNMLSIPNRKSNEHMPYVSQKENVALVMFRPNKDLELFGYDELDVALRWNESDFDEIEEFGRWSIGRKSNSYVAVLKHCSSTINGVPACGDKDGQTWAIVVGNSTTHGSFNQFKDVIRQASYKEKWIRANRWKRRWNYYGRVTVDGKNIEYTWKGDNFDSPRNSSSNSRTKTIEETEQEELEIKTAKDTYTVFPNPANQEVSVVMTNDQTIQSLVVVNQLGAEVFRRAQSNKNSETISTANWNAGVYIMLIQTDDGKVQTQKLIVTH